MSGPKSEALRLVCEQGWFVFRLSLGHNDNACDGGTANCKTVETIGHEKWSAAASNDPDVVAGWDWSSANAYGIDCGKSGLVVADQDPGATWPFNGTRVHTTGRGRHHIYEDVIGLGNRADLKPWNIDVRGYGGMIIGPGSWHPHGGYAVEDDAPVAAPPAELMQALTARKETPTGPAAGAVVQLDPLEALDRLEGVYRRMEATTPGSRNHMLNVLAGTAAGIWVRLDPEEQTGELDEARVKEHLLASVTDDGDPAKTAGTIESGWAYGLEHPVPDGPEGMVGFFDRTPTLAHIRDAAHSRGIGAPSVLAAVLGHIALQIPVGVDLPPVVGAPAPLNAGFALVGDSGASKSTSETVARELLAGVTPEDWLRSVGSGEGLIDAFYEMQSVGERNKKVATLVPESVRRRMFTTDEGEALQRLMERAGTTLGGFLRTALTGGMLGTSNSLRGDNNRRVPSGTYRFVMVIAIHPDQADVLLAGEGNGFPQRFCWMPADDPALPDRYEDLPSWPGPLDWTLPDLWETLDYPERIKSEVRQRNLDHRHGQGHRRRAHATLTQLKLAQLLAVLHGEPEITEQWWGLAAELSDASLAEQDRCERRLNEVRQRARNSRALADARAEDAAGDDRLKRAVGAVVEKLRKRAGETLTWTEGKPAHRLTKDLDTEEIVEALGEQTGVTVDVSQAKNGGVAYRLRWDR